jgi:hypothetical protein
MNVYRVMNTFPGEENGRHEYDIHVESINRGTKYSLIRSKAGHWSESVQGETACAVIDNGDGFKISKHVTREMDYAIMSELFILMSFINKQGLTNCFFMGTIEEVKQIVEI